MHLRQDMSTKESLHLGSMTCVTPIINPFQTTQPPALHAGEATYGVAQRQNDRGWAAVGVIQRMWGEGLTVGFVKPKDERLRVVPKSIETVFKTDSFIVQCVSTFRVHLGGVPCF